LGFDAEHRHMVGLLINIDVPDMEAAVAFYTSALGLKVGRRFDADFVELTGSDAPFYLLKKASGTTIGPAGGDERRTSGTGLRSTPTSSWKTSTPRPHVPWRPELCRRGRPAPRAMASLPCSPIRSVTVFCLIQFNAQGYDALIA
jgi:hypothetical protein